MYVPILKARRGEFRALAALADGLAPHLLPVLEVVPTAKGPGKDLWEFSFRAAKSVPRDLLIAVDTHRLAMPLSGLYSPLEYIAEDLHGLGVPMLPVLYPSDTDEQLAVAGHAARLHCGRAVIRLGNELAGLADLDDEAADRRLRRVETGAGLAPQQCDLLLDMFDVGSERDLIRAEPIVRKCLTWAGRRPWRSVTVAAGAMPASISTLARQTATPVRRWDLALWQRLRDSAVQFGDYGITHPQTTRANWRPSPNLRYTHGDTWWIYRWPSGTARSAMHELCRALVESEHWPAEGAAFSWGDAEIAQRAAGLDGPGNATTWRAWGTSHHIAHVMDQLSRHPG